MEIKMNKLLSAIGIVLVLAGTVFSLWSILGTKTKDIGTAGRHDNQQDYFKKDKIRVIIGTILISFGSLLQIVGLFF